MKVPFW